MRETSPPPTEAKPGKAHTGLMQDVLERYLRALHQNGEMIWADNYDWARLDPDLVPIVKDLVKRICARALEREERAR